MSRLPSAIQEAAAEFDRLPGIGPRAALRYVFWLVTQPKERIRRFAEALLGLIDNVKQCRQCGGWSESELCRICSDPKRDKTQLCVVATTQDRQVIDDSGVFNGLYHILGGLLDPIEGVTPEALSIKGLMKKLTDPENSAREVILAFDPDIRGDTTALYLSRQLSALPVSVTRLARGLPNGAQIEYADGETVADAFENRRHAN